MSNGNNGKQGKRGFQGVQGNQGEQGVQGNQGVEGRSGAAGSSGAAGAEGPKGTVSLTVLVLLVVVPLVGYLFARDVENVNNTRAACERDNGERIQYVGLLDDLVEVNQNRIEAPGATPSEKAANREARDTYADRKQAVIDTIVPALASDPRQVDCEEAHPLPFPLN